MKLKSLISRRVGLGLPGVSLLAARQGTVSA